MHIYSIKIIVLLALFINACGSSNKQARQSKPSSDTVAKKTDSMPKPPYPEPGLSPGFAKIIGTVVSISELKHSKSKELIIFRVNQVLDYGSSTPAIPSDDTLKISIEKEQLIQNDLLTPGKNLTLLIYHREQPVIESGNKTPWSFSKLITD